MRRRRRARRGAGAALVVVGVLGGLVAGVLGAGAPTGPTPPAPSGATEAGGGDGVGPADAPLDAATEPSVDGATGADGATEARSEDVASRSVRDPQLGVDGSGVLPLTLERVVEDGSGLVGREVVTDLGGVLAVVPAEVPAPGAGTVRTVRVEVEQGLPVDGETFADAVLATLNDPRGWGPVDGVTFARTGGDTDVRVVLASPATTDRLCAPLDTGGVYSCGVTGVAVLNFRRWVEGASDFGGDLELYRHYLVNHEVGHVLGHGHVGCPAPGALAPVMVQQSMSTEGCLPNGWPTL
ncbi:DUF3152 domain-containing protein [Oerskovia sp. Sa1BUA8]|uniref:DUF3152 domain-containing protein n=1 Tax=Oerskovia douganii TaxID=2762210 RepID=A0A9D5U9U7_9CELL|nr:DUF3152 domain-containing protein [Oerskovia douganii]